MSTAALTPAATAEEAPDEAQAAPIASWHGAEGALTLLLRGDWRGAQARGIELPAPPADAEAQAVPRGVRIDARDLQGWDAGFAALLWQRLSGLPAQTAVDLAGLPPGLRQVLELATPATPVAPAPAPLPWLAQVDLNARQALSRLRTTLEFFGDTTLALGRLLRGRSDLRASDLAWQLEQTGPRSLPILLLVCFLVGLILAYMGGAQLHRFGAETYVADLVTVGVVREVAALLVGIVLAGRVGAAFAAQLGSMQANDEIDALRAMGVDPVGYLVLPRVLALLVVGPLLTAFGAVVGMFVGWLVAVVIFEVSPLEYLFSSWQALTLPHVLIGLLKGTVYSVLVGLAGCRQGLAAGRSAQAVGDAVTTAVVQGMVWVVIAASVLTVVFQRLDI